jgi:uncharacterized membrane protein YccC
MDRFTGQSGTPSWWLGAPLIGVLFGFVANRFFPGFVESIAALIYRLSGNGPPPAALAPDATRFLAPLIGMLLAVVALAAVQLVKRLTRMRQQVGA